MIYYFVTQYNIEINKSSSSTYEGRTYICLIQLAHTTIHNLPIYKHCSNSTPMEC